MEVKGGKMKAATSSAGFQSRMPSLWEYVSGELYTNSTEIVDVNPTDRREQRERVFDFFRIFFKMEKVWIGPPLLV